MPKGVLQSNNEVCCAPQDIEVGARMPRISRRNVVEAEYREPIIVNKFLTLNREGSIFLNHVKEVTGSYEAFTLVCMDTMTKIRLSRRELQILKQALMDLEI